MKTFLTLLTVVFLLLPAVAQQPLRTALTTNTVMNAPIDGFTLVWNNSAKKWSNATLVSTSTNVPSYVLTNSETKNVTLTGWLTQQGLQTNNANLRTVGGADLISDDAIFAANNLTSRTFNVGTSLQIGAATNRSSTSVGYVTEGSRYYALDVGGLIGSSPYASLHTYGIDSATQIEFTTPSGIGGFGSGGISGLTARFNSKDSEVYSNLLVDGTLFANLNLNLPLQAPSRVAIINGSGNLVSDPNVDTTELGFIDGLTANVQNSLNGKVNNNFGLATNLTVKSDFTVNNDMFFNSASLGFNRVLMLDGSKMLVTSANVDSTELGFLDGVTSGIQGQLNGKVANNNGLATNLTTYGLTAPNLTASRPAFIDASGNLTNATGTPDGTKFMRDDGVLAVPPGGGGGSPPGGVVGNLQVNGTGGVFIGSTNGFYDPTNQMLLLGGPTVPITLSSIDPSLSITGATRGIYIRTSASTNVIGPTSIGNRSPDLGGGAPFDFFAGGSLVFRIDSVGGIISGRPNLATDARNWGIPDRLFTTNATKWLWLTNGIVLGADDIADIGQPNVGIRTNYANTIINKDGIFGAYDGITPFPLQFGIFNSNIWRIRETTPIGAFVPASSNFNDVGEFGTPVRTNWANGVTVKQGFRSDGTFALTPTGSTQAGTNTVWDGASSYYTNRFNSVSGGLTNIIVTNLVDGQILRGWVFPSNGVTVQFPQFTAANFLDGAIVTPFTNTWSEIIITKRGNDTNIDVRTATFSIGPGSTMTYSTNFVNRTITTDAIRVGVYRTLYVDAAAMISNSTAGASFLTEQSATPTNRMVDSFVFDGAVTNSVQFKAAMPLEWDLLTVKVKLWTWTTNNVATSTNVYGIAAAAIKDTSVLTNVDWGTELTITNVVSSAAGAVQLSPSTPSLTVGNTPAAAGNLVWFRIRRLPGHANDNDGGQSKVLGAWVQYKEGLTEPATW